MRLSLFVLVCSCSAGASTHTAEPTTFSDNRHEQPRTFPAAEADASVEPVPERPVPDGTHDWAPPTADVRGWYCHTRYSPSEGPAKGTTSCHRTAAMCENHIRFLKSVRGAKLEYTTCYSRQQAYCFRVSNSVAEYVHTVCTETMKDCIVQRSALQANPEKYPAVGPCDERD